MALPLSFADFPNILKSVTGVLTFLALLALLLVVLVWISKSDTPKTTHPVTAESFAGQSEPTSPWVFGGAILVFVVMIGAVVTLAILRPQILENPATPAGAPGALKLSGDTVKYLEQNKGVAYFKAGPPAPDAWTKELLPVLHQAAMYSVPCYFLDTKLRMIDWNVAFELLFAPIVGKLRGQHVNYFIVALENREQVFDHAQDFTNLVQQGQLPLVDTESLCYASTEFGGQGGIAKLLKVAVQLHDPQGNHRGWSVALFPQDIAWNEFQNRLQSRIREDKRWSVYSASYDRVLTGFPPYQQLISDVIGVIPVGGARKVADLGAGTGNVTDQLVARGHRVTAVENNAGMLDKLRDKHFSAAQVTIVKASVEQLELLETANFDAVVMVNVLYAVDDPLGCLTQVHRILRSGGVLGLSMTHADTRLAPLLAAIKAHLQKTGRFNQLAADYQAVYDANVDIEQTIARRWSRDQYRQWIRQAGFEILHDVSSTYLDAVMLIHARKI